MSSLLSNRQCCNSPDGCYVAAGSESKYTKSDKEDAYAKLMFL